MSINLDNLGFFGKIATATGSDGCNTVQIGDDGNLKAGKKYSSTNLVDRLHRSKADQIANNKVRTELLKSLASTLNVEIGSDSKGNAVFTKDFMNQLEKMLGKDVFAKSNFGIDKNGYVTSGSPLTERRITAIVNRVHELSKPKDTGLKTAAALLTATLSQNMLQLDNNNAPLSAYETAQIAKEFKAAGGTLDCIDTVGKITAMITKATGRSCRPIAKSLFNLSREWENAPFSNGAMIAKTLNVNDDVLTGIIRLEQHEKSRVSLEDALGMVRIDP